jgi:hypothetical protein
MEKKNKRERKSSPELMATVVPSLQRSPAKKFSPEYVPPVG